MSSEAMKSWNLNAITSALGLISPGGAAEDGYLTAKPLDPKFDIVKGLDGSVVRFYTGKRLWEVTYTLLMTSATNDDFAALHKLDDEASRMGLNGAGVVPWFVKNNGGTMLISSPRAWLCGPPEEVKIEDKPGSLAWKIHAADVSEFIGGVPF